MSDTLSNEQLADLERQALDGDLSKKDYEELCRDHLFAQARRANELEAENKQLREVADDVIGDARRYSEMLAGDPEVATQIIANTDLKVRVPAAEVQRLRDALAWYELQARDCRKIHGEGDLARRQLDLDGGDRARAALSLARDGAEK